jgi:outer membrane receptor protein involved in Fe transport
MKGLFPAAGLGLLCATVAFSQEPTPSPSPAPPPEEDQTVKRSETVVVTASKVETTLLNAPATMSVISGDTIVDAPAQNFGDLLRSVPGMNVTQTSARDFNITSRQATGTLTNSQLVLLDGRSIYLDFFGLVLWDFVPQNPADIKQIEVVRGPASAVWGANALTGVINIITKTPREAQGYGATLTGGLFGRSVGSRADEGSGKSAGGNFTVARAPNDSLAWRLSAGYFYSDPYSRPQGQVPLIPNPVDPSVTVGGGTYPPDREILGGYQNEGTKQPKADLRVDQEFANGGRMTYQGGYSGTTGIVHTGIGPFDIQSGSYLTYGKLQYTKGALRVAGFGNFVDCDAPNELARAPDGSPVVLGFKTQTYDFEAGHSTVVGGKHLLSYGGNARRNNFDITIAPNGENRTELGAYLQEEYFVDKFRLSGGLRVDKFGNLEDPFFSPRVSLMFKPLVNHAFRVSYNRAFRAPSLINNFLEQEILAPRPIDLRPLGPLLPAPLRPFVASPFFLVVNNVGRVNLKAQSLTAYEFAYTGSVGDTTLGFAVYQNDMDDDINFTNLTTLPLAVALANGLTFYSPANPARVVTTGGQPLTFPPALMGVLAAVPPQFRGPIMLPSVASTYLNFGPLRQRGLELSLEHQFGSNLSGYVNYSYQNEPKTLDPDSDQLRYPLTELNLPAKNRFNAGVSANMRRFVANAQLSFVDKAFWQDVLNPDFAGFTDSYTLVNATVGSKWADGKVVTSLKGTNLLNKTIQQHIYGDILKIGVVGEVRVFVR